MIAIMLSLVLSPPMPFHPSPELDQCWQVVCPFTPDERARVCYCAPAVLRLGPW